MKPFTMCYGFYVGLFLFTAKILFLQVQTLFGLSLHSSLIWAFEIKVANGKYNFKYRNEIPQDLIHYDRRKELFKWLGVLNNVDEDS